MRKDLELSEPTSCLNKAAPNEHLFVLLARDVAAPDTIRHWCKLRIDCGRNTEDDDQIQGALLTARQMEEQYTQIQIAKHEQQTG